MIRFKRFSKHHSDILNLSYAPANKQGLLLKEIFNAKCGVVLCGIMSSLSTYRSPGSANARTNGKTRLPRLVVLVCVVEKLFFEFDCLEKSSLAGLQAFLAVICLEFFSLSV